jgi:hypothetical protein
VFADCAVLDAAVLDAAAAAGCGIGMSDSAEVGTGCTLAVVEMPDNVDVTPLGGARGGRVKHRLCVLSMVEFSPTAFIMVSNSYR